MPNQSPTISKCFVPHLPASTFKMNKQILRGNDIHIRPRHYLGPQFKHHLTMQEYVSQSFHAPITKDTI